MSEPDRNSPYYKIGVLIGNLLLWLLLSAIIITILLWLILPIALVIWLFSL